MFSGDRPARDSLVDELKEKIRTERALLEHRMVMSNDEVEAEEAERPHRAKKLTEVFRAMGFEG